MPVASVRRGGMGSPELSPRSAAPPPHQRVVHTENMFERCSATPDPVALRATCAELAALAERTAGEGPWRLGGLCPWVTGADSSNTIVTGAATVDGGQLFFVVPTDATGLVIEPPLEMLALSGSRTSVVRFEAVRPTAVIAPPAGGPRTGGLATTAVAVGAARAAIAVLGREAEQRAALEPVAVQLETEAAEVSAQVHAAAVAGIDAVARDRLRTDANSLVVRAAQAALTATKGAGFVRGHPAERLARESLFFLVWSCPQAVATATLCELAGLTAAT